jgi:hypothetical protein
MNKVSGYLQVKKLHDRSHRRFIDVNNLYCTHFGTREHIQPKSSLHYAWTFYEPVVLTPFLIYIVNCSNTQALPCRGFVSQRTT